MRQYDFREGQRVFVSYHNIYVDDQCIFKPPAKGTILFRDFLRREHHFSGFSGNRDGLCYWWWVEIDGHKGPFLFPDACIEDLEEYQKRLREFLSANEHWIGDRGYSQESYSALAKHLQ